MKEISKIGVLSVLKVLGILGATGGFLASTIGILTIKILNPNDLTGAGFSEFATSIVTITVLWGVVGAIGGALFAYLYNLLTDFTKGIKIKFK